MYRLDETLETSKIIQVYYSKQQKIKLQIREENFC